MHNNEVIHGRVLSFKSNSFQRNLFDEQNYTMRQYEPRAYGMFIVNWQR